MKTELVRYDSIKKSDKIFTNGKDNHAFRKLGFLEIEVVKSAESYQSGGNGILVLLIYESENSSLGFPERTLERIID